MCSLISPIPDAKPTPRAAAILCVDDSPSILIICQTMLEARGYKVYTASDGKEALQTLATELIDLVIVDNRMPGMNGVDLAKAIKRVRVNLPVLMFSDSGEKPRSSESIDLFLNKMIGPRALSDAVESLLSGHLRLE